EKQLLKRYSQILEDCDGVVIEDYGKGIFSESFTQQIIQLAHQQKKKVIVDPYRTTPLSYYKGADVVKPNRDEAFLLAGYSLEDLHHHKNTYIEVGLKIMEKVQAESLVVTRGKEGMSLFLKEGIVHLPTYARQVYDVTGAGDAVLAAMGLGW